MEPSSRNNKRRRSSILKIVFPGKDDKETDCDRPKRRVSFANHFQIKNFDKEETGLFGDSITLPVPVHDRVSPVLDMERNEGAVLHNLNNTGDMPYWNLSLNMSQINMESASFVQQVFHFETRDRHNKTILGEVDMSMSCMEETNPNEPSFQTTDDEDSGREQNDLHNKTAITSFEMEDVDQEQWIDGKDFFSDMPEPENRESPEKENSFETAPVERSPENESSIDTAPMDGASFLAIVGRAIDRRSRSSAMTGSIYQEMNISIPDVDMSVSNSELTPEKTEQLDSRVKAVDPLKVRISQIQDFVESPQDSSSMDLSYPQISPADHNRTQMTSMDRLPSSDMDIGSFFSSEQLSSSSGMLSKTPTPNFSSSTQTLAQRKVLTNFIEDRQEPDDVDMSISSPSFNALHPQILFRHTTPDELSSSNMSIDSSTYQSQSPHEMEVVNRNAVCSLDHITFDSPFRYPNGGSETVNMDISSQPDEDNQTLTKKKPNRSSQILFVSSPRIQNVTMASVHSPFNNERTKLSFSMSNETALLNDSLDESSSIQTSLTHNGGVYNRNLVSQKAPDCYAQDPTSNAVSANSSLKRPCAEDTDIKQSIVHISPSKTPDFLTSCNSDEVKRRKLPRRTLITDSDMDLLGSTPKTEKVMNVTSIPDVNEVDMEMSPPPGLPGFSGLEANTTVHNDEGMDISRLEAPSFLALVNQNTPIRRNRPSSLPPTCVPQTEELSSSPESEMESSRQNMNLSSKDDSLVEKPAASEFLTSPSIQNPAPMPVWNIVNQEKSVETSDMANSELLQSATEKSSVTPLKKSLDFSSALHLPEPAASIDVNLRSSLPLTHPVSNVPSSHVPTLPVPEILPLNIDQNHILEATEQTDSIPEIQLVQESMINDKGILDVTEMTNLCRTNFTMYDSRIEDSDEVNRAVKRRLSVSEYDTSPDQQIILDLVHSVPKFSGNYELETSHVTPIRKWPDALNRTTFVQDEALVISCSEETSMDSSIESTYGKIMESKKLLEEKARELELIKATNELPSANSVNEESLVETSTDSSEMLSEAPNNGILERTAFITTVSEDSSVDDSDSVEDENPFVRFIHGQLLRLMCKAHIQPAGIGKWFLSVPGPRSVIVIHLRIPLAIVDISRGMAELTCAAKVLSGPTSQHSLDDCLKSITKTEKYITDVVEKVSQLMRVKDAVARPRPLMPGPPPQINLTPVFSLP